MILIEEIQFKGFEGLQSKINAIEKGGFEFVQLLERSTWGHDEEDTAIIIFRSNDSN